MLGTSKIQDGMQCIDTQYMSDFIGGVHFPLFLASRSDGEHSPPISGRRASRLHSFRHTELSQRSCVNMSRLPEEITFQYLPF